jgi:3-phenylpropionate/trans-cinnamate dioxygenase ferredoxin component
MPSVGTITDLQPGQMRAVDLQGTRVAIANVNGRYYAFSNVCPHDDSHLTLGDFENPEAICPVDGSRFDLASGNVLQGPALKRIRTYRIQIEGDELRI